MPTAPEMRPVLVYLASIVVLTVSLALAFPHLGLVAPLTAVLPVLAVAIAIHTSVRRGHRREAWAAIGWRVPSLQVLGYALAVPAVVVTLSFTIARLLGVIDSLRPNLLGLFDLVLSLALTPLLFVCEEIGWRGFLFPRLATRMPRKHAALVTGAVHGAFHLPLLLLTDQYQSAGHRWIVVPMVLVTITLAGVMYAWLQDLGGSVWGPTVMHAGFNLMMEKAQSFTVAGSAATLAYVTTETGVLTLALAAIVAGYLLTRPWPTPARTAPAALEPPAMGTAGRPGRVRR